MTPTRAKFIKLLTFIQNAPEHVNRNILTFSAFMDDVDLASHIIANAREMSRERQSALMAMMRDMREAAVKEAA